MLNLINGFVYKITSPRGNSYIGQTRRIGPRFRHYRKPNSRTGRIYDEIRLCGWENMTVDLLFKGKGTRQLLSDLEMHFIRLFNTFDSEKGLNDRNGALIGAKASKKCKENMSRAHTGWKDPEQVCLKKQRNNANCRLILDFQTGIYYNSCSDAERCLNINTGILRRRLNGKVINNTFLKYV